MEFPSIASVAEAVKGAFASESEPATPAEPTTVESTETPKTEPAAAAPTTEPKTPEQAPTETPSTIAAKFISEKGVTAFLADLPEEVKEKLGPELNKNWYKRLNERDAEMRRIEAKQTQEAEATRRYIDQKMDELVTAGMSEEDKKAYGDKKELDRLRAKEAQAKQPVAPTEEQVSQMLASHPVTQEFWRAIEDAGLPKSVDDSRVAAIWQQAYTEPTPQAAVAKIRSLAAAHKKPQAPAVPAVDIDKLVAERLEVAMDKKLKAMGLLKSDSGRPGSGGPEKPSNSWDAARKGAEEMLRESGR